MVELDRGLVTRNLIRFLTEFWLWINCMSSVTDRSLNPRNLSQYLKKYSSI